VNTTAGGRIHRQAPAALDVVDPEPLPRDHPLWTIEGVVITLHIAGGSASCYSRAKRRIAEQLRRFAAAKTSCTWPTDT
jgi:phosphoglycerate dehydrogenase-like enzyme